MITTSGTSMFRGRAVLALAMVVATFAAVIGPAQAENGGGRTTQEVGVGFFYGTFGESPNQFLLVGGTAEEFCAANPDEPFGAEPGAATAVFRERSDGSLRIKIRGSLQPMYLYEADVEGAPPWIAQVCAGVIEPELLASGIGRLKVRDTIYGEADLDIFNSVRGRLLGEDGTLYRVRASADFSVVGGVPDGDPSEFVSFDLRTIG